MERMLTLHFVDGSKLSFEFDEQSDNAMGRKVKVEDFMESNHLVIEAEGQVLIFPVANIKYMALSAGTLGSKETGSALPRHAILRARIRS
jgi:hypothetical protein